MKLSILLDPALLLLIPSATCLSNSKLSNGCGSALPKGIQLGKSVNLTSTSKSGVSPRKYRLYLPESYDVNKQVPLIVSFHGRGQDAKYQEELTQFSNPNYGFEGISVYPEGVPNATGTQQFEGDPDSPSYINDVTFTLELLAHLQSTFCIDSSRIYANGKSNGGGFTGLLACDTEATKHFAAFAPVSGAFYLSSSGKLPACKPSRSPIPILELHGWADKTIRYLGGNNTRDNGNTTNIPNYFDEWAVRNGYKVSARTTSSICSGRKKVTRHSWDDVVVHYNYSNVAHDWPSANGNEDTKNKSQLTCEEAEGTKIVLDWLGKWTL